MFKTGLQLKPAALEHEMPAIAADEDPRLKLADWMSSPKNPFFAKSVVNRYWKHFFRRGLIEPEDDIPGFKPSIESGIACKRSKSILGESGFDLEVSGACTGEFSRVPAEFGAQ
ncbi:MAG: DUF1553 domain-containing protein [Pirellulales bacterium]